MRFTRVVVSRMDRKRFAHTRVGDHRINRSQSILALFERYATVYTVPTECIVYRLIYRVNLSERPGIHVYKYARTNTPHKLTHFTNKLSKSFYTPFSVKE